MWTHVYFRSSYIHKHTHTVRLLRLFKTQFINKNNRKTREEADSSLGRQVGKKQDGLSPATKMAAYVTGGGRGEGQSS